ncbi:MFS transporter [Streptomyces prasinopilosus]|uniref:MFS transporter, AAHS family, benzoate transport protein n=1 Tax=Streptomyces prasinopilosus TaxID=67344 RepID=A0A1G6LU98_9ACTN|nr:aromatic acid/H+ symport family MFS transporter [Streptomyces prasinopilosus]SDC46276.1 MFS transporter, AAHS family, benzoate transport protein [Streptomyces prasinopilosus]
MTTDVQAPAPARAPARASARPPAPDPTDRRARALTRAVVALCTAAITVEGFDLIVYGVAMPSMLADPGLGLDKSLAGTLGSLVYLGMLIGAVVCGPLADRLGRRRLVLASGVIFTLFTVGCAVAATPWQFGLFRLLAGIGMGGVMPSCVALAKEYAPRGRSALVATVVLAGVPVGGVLAALTAAAWGGALGWRGLFGVGAALSTLVFAGAYALLPDSRPAAADAPGPRATASTASAGGPGSGAGLASGGPAAEAKNPSPARSVLSDGRARTTVLFVVANFAVLLAWYGLNTWLTQLMREMDYPLGSALQFTLVLNLGAVIGSFAIAAVADRIGPRFVTIGSAALSAVAVVGLSLGGNTVVVLCLTALAGVGAHSSLTVLNDWVASSYPASIRATALGYVSGFGRGGAIVAPLLGGWILTASLGPTTVFYVFAASAALSAAALLAIPSRRA